MSANLDHRALFDHMVNGFAYCQMVYKDGEPEDFLYLDVNEAFETLTGIRGAKGKLVSEVIPGIRQSDPGLFARYDRVVRTGGAERFEFYLESLRIWFDLSVYSPKSGHFVVQFDNISVRKQAEKEQAATIELLDILNLEQELLPLVRRTLAFFHKLTGCQAVGLRLKDGQDYPYFETTGFSPEFVKKENSLCARDEHGRVILDPAGKPLYECMCGNILCGRYDAAKPFFTVDGAFWSGHTTELLASTGDQDRMARTRNYCNAVGYESVALIPLKNGGVIFGLLQLNDPQLNRFDGAQIAFYERLAQHLSTALSQHMTKSRLEESELRYRRLVENLNDLVSEVDSHAIYTYVSPRVKSLLGYEPSELLGQSFAALAHPDEQESLKQKFTQLLETKEAVSVVRRLGCKTGGWKWFESSATLTQTPLGLQRIIVISRDISERLESEHHLADERERLAVTLESLSDGVVTTDMGGRITLFNPSAEAISGWKTEEVKGKTLGEVLQFYDFQSGTALGGVFEALLFHGEGWKNHAPLHLRGRGTTRCLVEITAAPVRDYRGRVDGLVMVIRDVTEKQKLTDAVLKNQRLESIGVLAGGIAHDFNNLLSGIFSFMELSRLSLAEGRVEAAQVSLGKAQSVFERTRALTRQLLTFAKGGEPVRKPLYLGPLVENSSRFALSGTSVEARFDIAPDLRPCDCDENQVGQVIDNLVINAVQAMPSGGFLGVKVQNVQRVPHQVEAKAADFVEVRISDTGSGIPKDIQEKIFDPFFTTKQQGNGLGLSTVHSIMVKHGGWIELDSQVGEGTEFRLYFPASAAMKEAEAPQVTAASPWQTGGCILIMDDEDYMREVFQELLTPLGFRTVPACDGDEALGILKSAQASGSPFTAAIFDLTIPGGRGGLDILAEARRWAPGVQLIASSGYSEDSVIAKPFDFGFDDSIAKPFGMEQMMELVIRISRRVSKRS